jgi:hypothetical protein
MASQTYGANEMSTTETENHLRRWTMPANYFGAEWPEYFVFLGQHRDSDSLTRSNFICGLKALGGESETIRVVRESHWAVGWVEWIAIHESDQAALTKANEIKDQINDYPVVDEDHWSALEDDEAAEFWNSLSPRDRVQMAIHERDKCHWLNSKNAPCWIYGRLEYYDMVNRDTQISRYLEESLRQN